MEDEKKTKKILIEEIKELRQSVAELKGFEEEIKQTRVDQEKFTKAFLQNSIPVGITTLKEGRFVDVSNAFLSLMGRKRNEVIGHTSLEIGFVTEEQRTVLFNELKERGRVENFEMEVRTKGGALRHGLFNAVMINLNKEKYLLTVMTDITERKRAEEALRERDIQFKKLSSCVPGMIYQFTKRPDGTYCVPFTTEAIKDIFGCSPQDVRKDFSPIARIILPEDFDKVVGSIEYSAKHLTIWTCEYRVQIPGQSIRWLLGNSTPEKLADGSVTWYGFNTDITERKRVEADKEKLEAQNQQLQKAESLGRMAGAIAHHFNNQLGVVIGNLEVAIDVMPLGAGPIENLTAAMEASNRAAEMSGLMLTYLGQTSGKRELLDISKACLRSLPILQAVIPGNVVLETDLPSPGPSIIANAIQIQQVLTNIITNAWEAAGEGRGSIHLRVKTVSLSDIPATHRFPHNWQPQDHAYACLEVTDAGCGIADEDIEKLFDPFFSSKFTGRGMGLPVVTGIVRAHGGVITVESEPGHGSTFRAFFPVSAEEVPQQPDKDVQPSSIEAGGTVLLVEDEEMVRNMAAAMLNRLGFSVLEAKDGVEAVEVFRQRQDEIRCVLTDLTMPRMNGWETLTALRKLAPDIPVILASGYDKAHVMAGDHPEWPQVFLGKPYKFKGLSDAISQALVSKKK